MYLLFLSHLPFACPPIYFHKLVYFLVTFLDTLGQFQSSVVNLVSFGQLWPKLPGKYQVTGQRERGKKLANETKRNVNTIFKHQIYFPL